MLIQVKRQLTRLDIFKAIISAMGDGLIWVPPPKIV
jgi:hypothetical protein